MVDIRLHSLVKIVETGSFTKAAEQMALSQPAVSQHIKQLEENLGVKIFEHSHNRFRLTKEGEIVLQYARRMIALDGNLRRTLKNEQRKLQSLTIGITHTVENSVIMEALADFVNQLDGLNLKILTNTADNLYTMLNNYELDFAVVEGRPRDTSLCSLMLDTDCLVLVVPPGHRLAGQEYVTLEQLKAERLILRLPQSNTRYLFRTSLAGQNLQLSDFHVTMEIDNIAAIKDLIRRGFGVSVLAKSACMDELSKGKLVVLPIENLSMEREIYIVHLKHYEHTDILQDIVRQYQEMKQHNTLF